MIKTSSLRHFEAYKCQVKIWEERLSTHNQTKLLMGSISPPEKWISTDWPTVRQWANDLIHIRKYAEGHILSYHNSCHPFWIHFLCLLDFSSQIQKVRIFLQVIVYIYIYTYINVRYTICCVLCFEVKATQYGIIKLKVTGRFEPAVHFQLYLEIRYYMLYTKI